MFLEVLPTAQSNHEPVTRHLCILTAITTTVFNAMAGRRAPFPNNPEDFASDTRISFSKAADNYILEDENVEEWEWFSRTSKWVPIVFNSR